MCECATAPLFVSVSPNPQTEVFVVGHKNQLWKCCLCCWCLNKNPFSICCIFLYIEEFGSLKFICIFHSVLSHFVTIVNITWDTLWSSKRLSWAAKPEMSLIRFFLNLNGYVKATFNLDSFNIPNICGLGCRLLESLFFYFKMTL